MRRIILLALLAGCVNYDGLEERHASPTEGADTSPIDISKPDALPPDSLQPDTIKACQVIPVGRVHHCMVDVPSPGITDDLYLFFDGQTDGIMGGDSKHYGWYRIVGQDTIIIINCGNSWEGTEVSVSYGCLP